MRATIRERGTQQYMQQRSQDGDHQNVKHAHASQNGVEIKAHGKKESEREREREREREPKPQAAESDQATHRHCCLARAPPASYAVPGGWHPRSGAGGGGSG